MPENHTVCEMTDWGRHSTNLKKCHMNTPERRHKHRSTEKSLKGWWWLLRSIQCVGSWNIFLGSSAFWSSESSTRAFRWYVESSPKCHSHLPLPLNRITAGNKSDEERVGWEPDAKSSKHVKTQYSAVFGLVALLTVPLNPVSCVFMLGLTWWSGERCDSLSGFRHIVAAKWSERVGGEAAVSAAPGPRRVGWGSVDSRFVCLHSMWLKCKR